MIGLGLVLAILVAVVAALAALGLAAEAAVARVVTALVLALAALGLAAEAASLATLVATAVAALPALTRVAGYRRAGVLQGRADLVDLDLEHGAAFALFGLVGTLTQLASDNDAHTLGQGFRDIFRHLAPAVAREEQGFAVFPLVRLPVKGAGRRRDAEVRNGGAARDEAQLRVCNQVADNGNWGIALSHVLNLPTC